MGRLSPTRQADTVPPPRHSSGSSEFATLNS
jgi:hypothetical protein